MRVTEMLMEEADVEPRTTLVTSLSRQPALLQLERMKRQLPRRDRALTPRVAVGRPNPHPNLSPSCFG